MYLKKLLKHIKETAIRNTEYASNTTMTAVSIIALFFYPVFYVVWKYILPEPYENFWIRFVAMVLCFFLLIRNHWPDKLKPYLPLYWHVTFTYGLTFFQTFGLLMNGFSTSWVLAQAVAFFIIVILYVDWIIISIMYFVGISVAWTSYYLMTGDSSFFAKYISYLPLLTFAVIAGFILNYSQKLSMALNEKLQAMFSAGTNVAHELRTPLMAIRTGINGIGKYLPKLLNGYKKAVENNIIKDDIDPFIMQCLDKSFDNLVKSVDYSNQIISTLLINTDAKLIDESTFKKCSIDDCIQSSIDTYPFRDTQKSLIHWDKKNDFSFIGLELLMIQVIHNLFRNSFYFIAKASKGEIYIWVDSDKSKNYLHFKDTGTGISNIEIRHIFKRFYTSKFEGTGVGLSFCKDVMESFNGEIYCQSELGEYTEFIMIFPKERA